MTRNRLDNGSRRRPDASGSTGARLRAAAGFLAVVALSFAGAALLTTSPAGAAPSLPQLEREAKRVRGEMQSLQSELQKVGTRLAEAQTHLDEVNAQLARSRADLRRAQMGLDSQREILASRAATMYKTGTMSWLDVLSSLGSLTDLDTIQLLQNSIAEGDRKAENEAQRLERDAQRYEKDIEKEHGEAVEAARVVQNEKYNLDQALAQRQVILRQVTKEIKKILASGGLAAALRMAPGGQFTQVTWAKALLVAMRLPVTADNVAAITAWEMAEGGHWYNTAYYNPLNTTQDMPGATVFNSVGVKAYTSWAQGLEATVKTLKNGYYDEIIAALQRGNDAEAVATAVGASPWGTGNFSRLL